MHVRMAGSQVARELETRWCAGEQSVPLVIFDAVEGSRASALRQALAVLQRTEQAGQITLVIPWQTDQVAGGLGLDDLAESSSGGAALTIHHAPAAS